MDNDGDVDIVVLNSRSQPTLLRNDSAQGGNHWIELKLRGTTCNRDGVGSRVEVFSGALVQVDEVHSGRGYQGHFGSVLHFGLGQHSRLNEIRVRWLGGATEVWRDLPVDRQYTLRQGEGER